MDPKTSVSDKCQLCFLRCVTLKQAQPRERDGASNVAINLVITAIRGSCLSPARCGGDLRQVGIISSSPVSTLGFSFPFCGGKFGEGGRTREEEEGKRRLRPSRRIPDGKREETGNIRAVPPLTSLFNEVLVGGVARKQPGGQKVMRGSDSCGGRTLPQPITAGGGR